MERIDFEDIHIEVANFDALEPMAWDEAMKWANGLGDGWRLPTNDELYLMYIARVRIGGFASAYYWSSSDLNYSNAWYMGFASGDQNYHSKYFNARVRAVRDVAP